jgi:hypothetical protein
MAAFMAYVFVEVVSVGQSDKLMAAEKAGKDVPDVRIRASFGEAALDALTTL